MDHLFFRLSIHICSIASYLWKDISVNSLVCHCCYISRRISCRWIKEQKCTFTFIKSSYFEWWLHVLYETSNLLKYTFGSYFSFHYICSCMCCSKHVSFSIILAYNTTWNVLTYHRDCKQLNVVRSFHFRGILHKTNYYIAN